MAKIWVNSITNIRKITNNSNEKEPIAEVIKKNQNVNPAVTARAFTRGDETSILNWINECDQTTLCKCSYSYQYN